jgi:hypothetical protein
MEHLSSNMEQQHEQVQWRRDKVQSFAVKDTAKGRYHKHCKLDWLR